MSVMPLPHYFPDYSDGVGETRLGQPYFLSIEFGIGSGALIQSLCMEGGGCYGVASLSFSQGKLFSREE